jgi:hypothetical protein
MSVMDTFTSAISKARTAMAGARDSIAALRAQIAATRTAIDHLETSAVPLDEVERRLRDQVRRTGEDFLIGIRSQILHDDRSIVAPTLRGDATVPRDVMSWPALCAADPEAAFARLFTIVRKLNYEPGPTSSERPAAIANLAELLQRIEREEEVFVDAANAHGLTIAHRPEVLQRRDNEQRAQQLQAERIANREAREAALNARTRRR